MKAESWHDSQNPDAQLPLGLDTPRRTGYGRIRQGRRGG
jgi:hypothetical protein